MAKSETTDSVTHGQLLEDALGQANARLTQALDTIQEGADTLRGLAQALEESAVSYDSSERVRSAAVTARAVATQIQLTALTLVESGERLTAWGAVSELLGADDGGVTEAKSP